MTNPYETELSLEDVARMMRIQNALIFLRSGTMKEKCGDAGRAVTPPLVSGWEGAGLETEL